jgi:drug/metabolite transporter (DMT)-like permease
MKSGAFFVGLAAILWATDTLFRYPLMNRGLDSVSIVLMEHLICLTILFPFILIRNRKELTALSGGAWSGLFFIGAGSSAVATVLFTASFGLVNPSVAILLQKLQPIFVTVLAFIFLKERPAKAFWGWGFIAILSGVILSFPQFNFQFAETISLESKGSIYALVAAAIWAIGTVVGKALLGSVKPVIVTFWRFAFGALALLILALAGGVSFSRLLLFTEPENLKAIGYIALVSGLAAMGLYYSGLKRTSATIATLMELLFPVTAVLINTVFLGAPLKPVQILAGLILIFSVTQIHSNQR